MAKTKRNLWGGTRPTRKPSAATVPVGRVIRHRPKPKPPKPDSKADKPDKKADKSKSSK